MITTVGEKIKTLRKELNMTQSQLAGGEMTKSMLSQIENNVSNPSMKTLQYIAKILNKPISYFLEDELEDTLSLKQNYESRRELESKIKNLNTLIDSNQIEEAKEQGEKLINSDIAPIKNFKLYGEILFKLGNALVALGDFDGSKKFLSLSIKSYIDDFLYIEAAKAYVELAKIYYLEFNYEECLNISNKAFELYYKNITSEPLFEIELYYYRILILSAKGNINDAIKDLETALELSNKTSIYYKTDEFYRILGFFNYLKGNRAEFTNCIDKALQFANFSKNNDCLSKINIILATDALDSGNPEKAIEYARISRDFIGNDVYTYNLILAKAYYTLHQYELAYKNIIKVNYSSKEMHKYDYLNMWSGRVYEGLIFNKLGKHNDAIDSIKLAIAKMSIFDDSKFLADAYKSLSEVYSDINDYQNAFSYLKKYNEIQDRINKDSSILF
ncbi:helix-turn-helix domain-containing protein [Clostridium sp. 'White wine YQ']|uniref:helix-turn-helix domain-containing protein n=1 Tax=Clostridium sp. 'White wine YQ' TaxID=3027474 RepID=UPI002365970B|nr:helix-turn-helix domain-containing protein [Clostridium sp. 'White wine YQ']